MKAMGLMCRLSAVAAIAICGSTAQAAFLTYDLRVAASQPAGVTVVDSHHAKVTAVGQIVNMELHTIIQNLDGDQTNDGFLTGQGSFVINPDGANVLLHGRLRSSGTAATTVNSNLNNVVPFKSTGATGGAQSDYNGDSFAEEVGKNSTATGQVNDWFLATSGSDPSLGVNVVAGDLDQLIGKTTFNVGAVAPAGPGQSSLLEFIPRLLTQGTTTTQNLHLFSSDRVTDPDTGVVVSGDYAMRGDDPRIAHMGSVVTWVPEPSSIALLGMGALGLLWGVRRRSA